MKTTKADATFQHGSSLKKKFGVSTKTLQIWSDTGKLEAVRLPGGRRLYSLPALNSLLGANQFGDRTCICYARVSSLKQAGDLERQISALRQS
jgi:predicted site-specific integrase-resolvase